MDLLSKINERLMTDVDVEVLNDLHPVDFISLYDELDAQGQNYILTFLTVDAFAEVLSFLPPEKAAELLEKMELKEQETLLNLIDPDDAADIIPNLETSSISALVTSLGEENKAVALLRYREDIAGSLMNNEFVAVIQEEDVKTATKKVIKLAGTVGSIQTIFVTDEEGRYQGQVPLKKLLKAKPPLIVADILSFETTFKDTSPTDDVVTFMREFSDHDLAIVNDNNILVGVITASDIIEEVHSEAMEDFAKLSALPEIDFRQGIVKSALKRLPWLLGLLVLSLVIALITAQYEAVIAASVVLTFFQPLILDVGGDVASQSLAVTLIALNKEDSNLKKTGKKEVISGLITGLSLAFVAFLITFLYGHLTSFRDPFGLALVISLSLILTVIIGFIFGFIVPVILDRVKLDPAVASGPFITTSIDIFSLLIYFTLALIIL